MLPFVGCWQRKTLKISAFPSTSRVHVGFTNGHPRAPLVGLLPGIRFGHARTERKKKKIFLDVAIRRMPTEKNPGNPSTSRVYVRCTNRWSASCILSILRIGINKNMGNMSSLTPYCLLCPSPAGCPVSRSRWHRPGRTVPASGAGQYIAGFPDSDD